MTTTLNNSNSFDTNDGVRAYVEQSLKMLDQVVEQVIPKDDVDNFKELLDIFFAAEDKEEKQEAFEGLVEILMQEPITVSRLDLDHEPGEEIQKWMNFVGKKIHRYRKAAKMSQEVLSEKTGLPQSHISRLESGKHSPSNATLKKIAAALDIEIKLLDPSA
ncbi:helix-turn-helix domain-containing protein [Gimesia maris]|uniref:Anaerobic benzoate catabolism transcriptional regulator n=1 Tax=Gimesia maris TaxID=122 RepID=A0ABX5YIX2_9PLAN|nr:helix-turn-helix transcriptional regulator [Gimesia maris]EDL56391.1 transcriptional regulator, XRE family protein [Gimesia maris DSM 8797]QEG15547.1 anaerobic benzoate catabolism transcriptional regulator [Gimesia maris]QGQ31154.1 helix-turn-helix transcriptional regulator [Gimesia maris]